jgi:catechol 2,3-dioxygenase-like lactoylglutathione lyase family enzyme
MNDRPGRNTMTSSRATGRGGAKKSGNKSLLGGAELVAFSATAKAAAAKAFYGETLGLPLESEDPFAVVFDANGTTLRVAIVPKVVPAGYTILSWRVPDVASAVAGLRDAGVKFERYPGMDQDELGIWSSPSGARIAWFKDPDGNTLAVSQY